jgi:lipopolysaccharide assembly outer membrane protein LptD (OstA)
LYKILVIYLFVALPYFVFGQEPVISVADKYKTPVAAIESDRQGLDTSQVDLVQLDTVLVDSISTDTLVVDSVKAPFLTDPIAYEAIDSMIVSIDGQKVYLYNEAKVTYQQIELTAYYIELDMATKEIYAEGIIDSTGEMQQKPLFKEGEEEYESETMRYNFESEKAFITKVVSQQGEGFILSDRTKKIGKDVFITENAKYTTCDAEHPHFYLQLSKAKVISNKKIITGPAHMVLEDFHIYFPFLPFGYFPNSSTYTSGILIPSYGEEENRGFFLRDGGYYWAANDYFDLSVQGDIYSKGSWGTDINTNYKKRYKFSGKFGFDYGVNKYGEKNSEDYYESKQFKVTWSHSQDSKANPNRSFSASVNLSSSQYDTQNADNSEDYLSTTKSSSISYSQTFENTPFNMSMNFRHSQNSTDSTVSLSLPEMTFSMSKVYPFKSKNRSGKMKFYEDFGINYTGNFKNTLSAQEDEVLSSSFATDWKNGIKHNIPISFPSFTLLKYLNFSPGISYNEKWYFKKYNYNYVEDGDFDDNPSTVPSTIDIDTITGFNRVYDYSYSLSSSTTIYGMYLPRNPNSKIKGIRHKMTPTVGFSYKPDFGRDKFGYWQEVQKDTLGNTGYYDINLGGVYGGSPSRGETGAVSFSLSNTLEMKMLETRDSSKSDEDQKYKKVKLLDNLSFSGSYNLIADSLNLSTIAIRARTTVAGVSVNMGTTLDPYMINDDYERIHKYAWNERSGLGKLGRVTSANLSFGLNFSSEKKGDKGGTQGQGDEQERVGPSGGPEQEGMSEKDETEGEPSGFPDYSDFAMPWNFSLDYSLNYTGPSSSYPNGNVSQTIGMSGNLTITEKWKLTARTNFDIDAGEFSYTSFGLTRDLHCWNMSFSFVPFGYTKSYSFTLSASSSMLSDLKIDKNKSYYDNFEF